MTLTYSFVNYVSSYSTCGPNDENNPDVPIQAINNSRYKYDSMSHTFMVSPLWGRVCNEFIERTVNMDHVQQQFDCIYKDLCRCIFTEMDAHLNYRDTDKTVRKRFKNYKPYWPDHLTKLWRDMAASEKAFRKSNRSLNSHHSLRDIYLIKQRIFDKALRDAKRPYNRHSGPNRRLHYE